MLQWSPSEGPGSHGLKSESCVPISLNLSSAINPVTTVSVDYSCSSGMVTVTWDLVFGANLYRATAVDGTGASLNCTSPTTSCQITMLKCGENYVVHVTAISDDCESSSNVSASFETGERPTRLSFQHVCRFHLCHVTPHLGVRLGVRLLTVTHTQASPHTLSSLPPTFPICPVLWEADEFPPMVSCTLFPCSLSTRTCHLTPVHLKLFTAY